MKKSLENNEVHPVMASIGFSVNSSNKKLEVDINDIYVINDAIENGNEKIAALKQEKLVLENTERSNQKRIKLLQADLGADYDLDEKISKRLYDYNHSKTINLDKNDSDPGDDISERLQAYNKLHYPR